jgi:cytochrome c-type biogenesis protein CcmE
VNPTRKRRLALVALVLLSAAAATTFIVLALKANLSYLHTPSEVREGKVPASTTFRLGGVVCEGSVKRTDGALDVRFSVTDRFRQVPVHFHGILPDMFREGTSIIAIGQMRDGEFVSSEVLAKHDENYRPKEVEDAMAKAATLHTKSCGAN